MQKALAVIGIAIVFAIPAYAEITIYDSGTETVKIRGRADIAIVDTQDETELVDGSSRLNFTFARDMDGGWETTAVVEIGINLVGETTIAFPGGDTFQTRRDDLLNLRLGYLGVTHPDFGSLTMGKLWGAFYDVAQFTDMGRTWGGAASGAYNFNGDGGLSGTGRAERAILYRHSFGDISFAFQAQFRAVTDEVDELVAPSNPDESIIRVDYDSTIAASVLYTVAGNHTFAAGYNEGTFKASLEDGGRLDTDDSVTAVGYRYGSYGDGLYVGLFYNDAEFHELDNFSQVIPESTGIEVFASYRGDSKWMPYLMYNSLEADSSYGDRYEGDDFHREFFAAGAIWFWDEKTDIYVDIRLDTSDMSPEQAEIEDDGIAIGLRYVF